MIQTTNPSTGELIKSYDVLTEGQIQSAIEDSHEIYKSWKDIPLLERCEKVRCLADGLRRNKIKYARLMAEEMGKPVSAGVTEIEKCAWVVEYYANHAPEILAPQIVETNFKKSYFSYEPSGVLLAIMPWNFPFWQVFRFAVPNIIAGNTVLLKHAPITTGCALIIEELFAEVGLIPGLLKTLIMNVENIESIISHDLLRGVSLTGSTRAGRSVAELSGRYLKKSVLELGGSDPYVVLEDADIDVAVEACLSSRFLNCGQTCVAAKRIIVVESIYEAFLGSIKPKIERMKIGDPMDPDTTLGPMARLDLRNELDRQVQESIVQGATLEVGGKAVNRSGFFYTPSLLSNVKPGMAAFDEELFGPVAVLIRAKDQKHALKLASNTQYGLGAAVFTNDLVKGEQIAKDHFEAGSCFVNSFVKSSPQLPFGGIKNSGYGRELGPQGLIEFTNIKTVCVE